MRTNSSFLTVEVDEGCLSRFISHLSSLNLQLEAKPEEHEYRNAVLIVCDAALSINRRYKEFVVPRIELIKKVI